jgi:hypothetical protein
MIFSARHGDDSIFRRLKEAGVLGDAEIAQSRVVLVENFTRQTGFAAARLRAMHPLKGALKTARALSTIA